MIIIVRKVRIRERKNVHFWTQFEKICRAIPVENADFIDIFRIMAFFGLL